MGFTRSDATAGFWRMRLHGGRRAVFGRLAPTAALLPLLAGCAGVGSYMHDTLDPFGTPNAPQNQSVNTQRALGQSVAVKPITPHEGDIWPGPVKPVPTLSEIQKDMNIPLSQEYQKQYGKSQGSGTTYSVPQNAVPQSVPGKKGTVVHQRNGSGTAALYGQAVKGSSTPQGNGQKGSLPEPKTGTSKVAPPGTANASGFPVGATVVGPNGPLGTVASHSNGRYQNVTPIHGKGGGILIPNGDNTATLIGPNGEVHTVHASGH